MLTFSTFFKGNLIKKNLTNKPRSFCFFPHGTGHRRINLYAHLIASYISFLYYKWLKNKYRNDKNRNSAASTRSQSFIWIRTTGAPPISRFRRSGKFGKATGRSSREILSPLIMASISFALKVSYSKSASARDWCSR